MEFKDLENKPRRVNICHLFYTIGIALIIIVFVLLIAPIYVTEEAFNNFSFAATITSIVLAVVSIVYSIQSGLSSKNSEAGLREIENRIHIEVERIGHLDNIIKDYIKEQTDPIKQQVGEISEGQTNLRYQFEEKMSMLLYTKNKSEQSDGSFNYKSTSLIGIFAIYLCAKIKETGKIANIDLLEQIGVGSKSYCYGFLIALSSSLPEKIWIEINKGGIIKVVQFDDNFWKSTSDIIQIALEIASDNKEFSEFVKEKFSSVDSIFEENDANNANENK